MTRRDLHEITSTVMISWHRWQRGGRPASHTGSPSVPAQTTLGHRTAAVPEDFPENAPWRLILYSTFGSACTQQPRFETALKLLLVVRVLKTWDTVCPELTVGTSELSLSKGAGSVGLAEATGRAGRAAQPCPSTNCRRIINILNRTDRSLGDCKLMSANSSFLLSFWHITTIRSTYRRKKLWSQLAKPFRNLGTTEKRLKV